LLSWALVCFLIGSGGTFRSLENLRFVKSDVISHSRAWAFLTAFAEIAWLSYDAWWSDELVGFATDNFQASRKFLNQRLGRRVAPARCHAF
jgi:hypothetical protein